jgi:ABC-type glycerol-3-phosphate transport system substrate-binding protein
MLHEGNRVLDNRSSLTPLAPYLTPEFKAQIVGWELTSDDYDPKKTAWAVPIAVQGLVWYYNKALLREAGFDPEKPPWTWDEFLQVSEAMKSQGKAGLAIGEKEGFWADWFLNTAYFQTCAPEDRERLRTGQMKWTDPKLVRIMGKLKELADRGCFQKGALSTPLFPDAGQVFMRGQAAFFLGLISDVAHWKEFGDMMGAENVGVTTCPVFQESARADFFPTGGAFAYAVTKWSPHPPEAFDYIAFIANDDNARTFLTDVGSFPANQSVPLETFTDPNAKKIAGWLAGGKAGPQLTDLLPTEVDDAFRRQAQLLLTGTVSVDKALAAVEAAAEKVRAR